MDRPVGFQLTNRQAMLFFRYCRRYKLEDTEGRINLLKRMKQKAEAVELNETDLRRLTKDKTVLRVSYPPPQG